MSRCFPFPPPGYERKLRVDDSNLLTKDKDNEKKRKRDKDNEKKERKDRDKDRSKEKRRERSKEKKEKHKHKDKKKDKDQNRDEKIFQSEGLVEKASSSSPSSSQLTSSLPGQAHGGKNGYVGGSNGNQSVNSGYWGSLHRRGEILDGVVSRHGGFGCESIPGFDEKVIEQRENGQTRFPKVAIVCNLSEVDQGRVGTIRPVERTIDKTTKEKEKIHRSDKNGERKERKPKDIDGRRFEVQAEKDMGYVQTLGTRIRDDKNGAIGSQIITKVSESSQERAESIQKVANGNTNSLHVKGGSKLANDIHKTENVERRNNMSKSPKVALGGHKMVEPSDMGKKGPIEGAKRNVYGGIGVCVNKENKILPKDNEGRNTVVEEEHVKQGSDHIIKLSRSGENSKGFNPVSSRQYTATASNNSGAAKRKVPEANGFIHGNEMQPEKLRITVISSQSPIGDGKKLQACPVSLSAHKQGIANSLKTEGQKYNGVTPLDLTKPQSSMPKAKGAIDARESLFGSTKPSSPIPKANEVIDVRKSVFVVRKSPIGSKKPPTSTPKANGLMIARESPTSSTKHTSSNVKSINGMILAPESPFSSIKPQSPMVESNVKAIDVNASKPPSTSTKPKKHREKSSPKPLRQHPDIKYLSHILYIPKMDEWSGFDDQDWLIPSKKTNVEVCSSTSEGDLQVWAKAVHIEAVDLYALPYVIPY